MNMFFFRTSYIKGLKFKILFNVLRGSFFPTPNVDSAVINLKKKALNKIVEDEEFFFEIVRTGFSGKFKTKA